MIHRPFTILVAHLWVVALLLKYGGIALSAAIGIYAITHDFKEGPEGDKKLTPAGRWAIFLSVLFAVITLLGTIADSVVQANKVSRDREEQRTFDESQRDKLKQDLKDAYDTSTKELEASLRRQYDSGRQQLEDSLKPVDSLDARLVLGFDRWPRPTFPVDFNSWTDNGIELGWSFVGRELFAPMLSLVDKESKQTYQGSMAILLGRDPFIEIMVYLNCEPSKDLMCKADAYLFPSPLPLKEDITPVVYIRYGHVVGKKVYVEFHFDRDALTTGHEDRSIVVQNILSVSSKDEPAISVALHGNQLTPPTPSVVEAFKTALPVEVTLTTWVNNNDRQVRINRFVRDFHRTRLTEMGALDPLYRSVR
jgi:hypothetical protein